MKDVKNELISIMLDELRTTYLGNIADAARAWELPYDNLYKWVNGRRTPRLETLGNIMGKLLNEQCLQRYRKIVKRNVTTPLLFDAVASEIDASPQRKISLYSIPIYDIANAEQDIVANAPLYRMDMPAMTADYADFGLIVDNDDYFPFIPHLSIVGISKNYKFCSGKTYVLNLGVEGYVLRDGTYKRDDQIYHFHTRHHDRRDNLEEIKVDNQEELQKIIVGQVVWILKRPI